jgi:hypothetical protein
MSEILEIFCITESSIKYTLEEERNQITYIAITILKYIVTIYEYVTELVNGFSDHLYTSLGTTSNYSAVANLHTLKITSTL